MKIFRKIILFIFFLLIIVSCIVIIIDPFFHYHKPLPIIKYYMTGNQQRYINNGMIRNFDYDAVIIGTSMTENFRVSQFNKLFEVTSLKFPFSGGKYKEINDNVRIILENKKDIKYILRGLDYGIINEEFEKMSYDNYPTYLYDDNVFNDYKYVLCRGSFFQCLLNIFTSFTDDNKKIDFDKYSSWREEESGKKVVLKTYERLPKENIAKFLSQKDIQRIDKNIEKNVIELPEQYPNTRFIYFITPYSIVYWDELNQKGELEKQIMAEKYMIKKILEVPNIELYSFFNNYEMITNLDNYKDAGHYMGHINDQILVWIKNKEYRLTKENYIEYINQNLEFYKKYNYNKIFEEDTESL